MPAHLLGRTVDGVPETRSVPRTWPSTHHPGLPGQVPRLLNYPLPARVVRAVSQMNAAAPYLWKDEDVEPGQPDRVHAEDAPSGSSSDWPSLRTSPWTRLYPQPGFSRASFKIGSCSSDLGLDRGRRGRRRWAPRLRRTSAVVQAAPSSVVKTSTPRISPVALSVDTGSDRRTNVDYPTTFPTALGQCIDPDVGVGTAVQGSVAELLDHAV